MESVSGFGGSPGRPCQFPPNREIYFCFFNAASRQLPRRPVVLSSLDATETQAIAAQARKTAVQNAVGRAKTASRGDQEASPQGYYRRDTEGAGGLGGEVVYSAYPGGKIDLERGTQSQ